MKYFSMFTGVGGFEIGISKALPNSECVGFSEIDKYCNMVLKYRFGEVENYGDAKKIKTDELPEFDLLCGGFPCQSFSIAGKRRGFEDTRGTLFFEIARVLEAKRPSYFLLENVKGLLNHEKGKTFRVIIQTLDELGYELQWMVLNSKFFGVPQNRERVFIIGNIRGTSRPEILPLGENAEKVSGVYETEDSRPEIGQAMRRYGINGVSPPLNNWSPLIYNRGRKEKVSEISKDKKIEKSQIIYDRKGFDSRSINFRENINISPTLTKKMGTGGNNVPMLWQMCLDHTKSEYAPPQYKSSVSRTLETSGNIAVYETKNKEIINPLKNKTPYGWHFEQNVYDKKGICRSVKSGQGSGNIPKVISGTMTGAFGRYGCSREEMRMYQKNYELTKKLRRLTPKECERLQGFPDGWTEWGINEKGDKVRISDTQRYKMMGNAVTVNVIEAIMEKLKKGEMAIRYVV